MTGLRHDAPVGVFDSGLGGLTVVREMLRLLPRERIVYVGDTAHVPYGGRPLDEVRGFAQNISRFLIEQAGCKAVVMACNISSAVARDSVEAAHPEMPILGVIGPGARAAVRLSGGAPVAVLATEGTVRSGAYGRVLAAESPGAAVTETACPDFVPLVEAGRTESSEALAAAQRYLGAALHGGARVVILGCTHYPFLLPTLARAAGPDVAFVDPAGETARELACVLAARDLAAPERSAAPPPAHTFYATGDPDTFAVGATVFLGDVAESVRHLSWREESLVPDGSDAH